MNRQRHILDSTREWDIESQRRFWNDWDSRHLQDHTLGREALRRGQVVLELIQSLHLHRPRILEIGCGNGWLAERLQAIGPVLGVDIGDEAIAAARRRVPEAQFVSGDILCLPLPASGFDLVVSLETLSHVSDQRRFVAIAADALCQDGHLILATQNRMVYMRRSGIKPPAEGQLRCWVTRRQLRRLLTPRFKCLRCFTIAPAGDMGFLRLLNSRKLSSLLQLLLTATVIEHLKEQAGLGQTIIALAEKLQ